MLSSLPTIGRKTAQRLSFFLLKQSNEYINQFTDSISQLKQNVRYCSVCFNYTEADPCPICSSKKRNESVICVVEEPNDVLAIEKTGEFHGMYHVLHGVINPLEGISQDDLKVRELVDRLHNVEEVILAINPSVEGEVTMLYLAKLLKPLNIKTTRLSRGIPIGSDIEFSDDATISKALENRVPV